MSIPMVSEGFPNQIRYTRLFSSTGCITKFAFLLHGLLCVKHCGYKEE